MWETLDRIDSPEDFIYDPYLVLCLPLYMLDGASFMSREAYGHLCTVTGALWTPQGRSFDGDDYITVPYSASLNIASAITIKAVVKPLGAHTGGYGSLWWDQQQDSRNRILISDDGSVTAQFIIGGVDKSASAAAGSVPLNVFTDVVFTYDGAEIVLWINGVKKTPTAATGAIEGSLGDRIIGKATTLLLNGVIGEKAVYNRALNPLEIQNNYLATKWRYK